MKKTSFLTAFAVAALLALSTSARAQVIVYSSAVSPYVVTPGASVVAYRAPAFGGYYRQDVSYVQPYVAGYAAVPSAVVVTPSAVAYPYAVSTPVFVGRPRAVYPYAYSSGYPVYATQPVYYYRR